MKNYQFKGRVIQAKFYSATDIFNCEILFQTNIIRLEIGQKNLPKENWNNNNKFLIFLLNLTNYKEQTCLLNNAGYRCDPVLVATRHKDSIHL